ncbi:MAG: helix-turn-helix domain-containing protein [Bifidobacterium tsurumiense]|uniref:helix-turn-helix domain-containing protein n=1 Tax=Bifidobacterium tsurumiense TaxID=356829 RepID=UPI002A7F4C1E|nr:helix-turn-helix domain-containing protein [Bifidobacterium tsurumiense]MDY4678397.1 helix-turn-helix domain-containing protein [Bifidobacterium tsurumiense]
MNAQRPDNDSPAASSNTPTTTDTLQAMSNPIRMRILGILRINGPRTVGKISQQMNEAPGAISYHLGQLSHARLVEKVASPDGDRRKSWWKARQDSTQFGNGIEDDDIDATSKDLFRRTAALSHEMAYERFLDKLPSLPDEWSEASANDDHVIRMTADDAKSMINELDEVIRKWERQAASASQKKEGTEPVALTLQVFRWIP